MHAVNHPSAKRLTANRRVGELPSGETPSRRTASSANRLAAKRLSANRRVGERPAAKRRVGKLSITICAGSPWL